MSQQVPTNDLDRAVAYLEANAQRSSFLASLLNYFQRYGTLTPKQLSSVLTNIEKDRASQRSNANPVTEVGMYRNAEGVFRVKQSKQSGNLYAMRFVPEATVKSERFVYERGGIYKLSATDRMTVEQAQELGALVGMCCVCGADLTDEKSVRAGIGPVCAKRV